MVRDGYFYGIGLLIVHFILHILVGGWIWPAIPLLLAVFFLWFFRDPNRPIPQDPGAVVSPADGLLTEIAQIQTPDGDRIRLSIFLSVFDVHVNRSPIAGTISQVLYQKGEYLNAMNPESAVRNERNTVVVDGAGCKVTFTQIAGLLARRIVFNRKAGDVVQRGERIGMIKFGSRVDVLLPASAQLRIARGQRVKGGASILAVVAENAA